MKTLLRFRATARAFPLASTSKIPLQPSIASARRHVQTEAATNENAAIEQAKSLYRNLRSSAPAAGVPPSTDDTESRYSEGRLMSRRAEVLGVGSEAEVAGAENHVFVKMEGLHSSTKPKKPSYVPLSSHVFGIQKPREDLVHAAVVYYLDSLRSGTASTKDRSEVAFSGKKIRPQKGTGRARLGERGNPLLKKGGVIHGPKPRDFSSELPRRVRELALRSALSARWREGRLHVVESFHWDAPPKTTNKLRHSLMSRQWENVLFLSAPREPRMGDQLHETPLFRRDGRPSAREPIYDEEQIIEHGAALRNFSLAVRNIPKTELIRLELLTQEAHEAAKTPEEKKKPGELHAYEVISRKHVVLDLGAVEWLEEKLGGAIFHEEPDHDFIADQERHRKELDLYLGRAWWKKNDQENAIGSLYWDDKPEVAKRLYGEEGLAKLQNVEESLDALSEKYEEQRKYHEGDLMAAVEDSLKDEEESRREDLAELEAFKAFNAAGTIGAVEETAEVAEEAVADSQAAADASSTERPAEETPEKEQK